MCAQEISKFQRNFEIFAKFRPFSSEITKEIQPFHGEIKANRKYSRIFQAPRLEKFLSVLDCRTQRVVDNLLWAHK